LGPVVAVGADEEVVVAETEVELELVTITTEGEE
jgi:hypothetical protein